MVDPVQDEAVAGWAGKPKEDRAAIVRRRARRIHRLAWTEGYLNGIATLLRPGDLAVDLGANVGVVTAELAATGADVVAFEPDPVTFAKLQARFAGQTNVTLVNAAVGVGAGTVRLIRGEDFANNPDRASVKSSIVDGARNVNAADWVEVELIDFPAWVRAQVAARGSIAFVKMDIEGSELELLEVMDRDGLFENIRGLFAETHEHKFKDSRDRYKQLKAAIAEHQPSGKIILKWI